ncbi:MAG: right-handed parallel beta-helix repeat-containing protein [Planctomycetota bacterium]
MRAASLLKGLLLWAMLAIPAAGATWFVARDGSGDFREITEALASPLVQDGDVLLVQPGTYDDFKLEKGVIIRAVATPFEIRALGSGSTWAVIDGIAAGKRAGLSGAVLAANSNSSAGLSIRNCPGEVIVEDVKIDWGGGYLGGMTITDAQNVAVSNLRTDDNAEIYLEDSAIVISNSSVRMSHSTVRIPESWGCDCDGDWSGCRGPHAMEVSNSRVIVSRCRFVGGGGGDGLAWMKADGGDGGDGLHATYSDVIVLGSTEDVLLGGDGGDASADIWPNLEGCGGNGGNGFAGDSAIVSLVTLRGGVAGLSGRRCSDLPDDGNPSDGVLTRRDEFPYLDVDTNLRPGQQFTATVKAVGSAYVRLLGSDQGGFADLPGVDGPPLSVLSGGNWFAELAAGHTDEQGFIQFTIPLEGGPHMEGFPLNLQAFVEPDTGGQFLTNAVVRVVGKQVQGRTIWVDDDAPGDPGPGDPTVSDPLEDGSDLHPFDDIQEAIQAAVSDDEVLIRDGVYTGIPRYGIRLGGRSLLVRSENGPPRCIIDCQNQARAFHFTDHEMARIAGLTITNGHADQGGAIWIEDARPVIEKCYIFGNTATRYDGGGVCCGHDADATIRDCLICSNEVLYPGDGGGISIRGGTARIHDCHIIANSASVGGGIYIDSNHPSIDISRCVIAQNIASIWGGGVYCSGPRHEFVVDSAIWDNEAPEGGGIFALWTRSALRHLTVANNDATSGGGFNVQKSDGELSHCIVWGNEADTDPQLYLWAGTITARYCDVAGGMPGDGNIDADPLFVGPGGGDFSLRFGSPCTNAGDPHLLIRAGETDIDLDPRVIGRRVDMGADESPFGTATRLDRPRAVR